MLVFVKEFRSDRINAVPSIIAALYLFPTVDTVMERASVNHAIPQGPRGIELDHVIALPGFPCFLIPCRGIGHL